METLTQMKCIAFNQGRLIDELWGDDLGHQPEVQRLLGRERGLVFVEIRDHEHQAAPLPEYPRPQLQRDAWASLNSDTSRPFNKPKSGKIAVKVINHLGDEVMKVFKV